MAWLREWSVGFKRWSSALATGPTAGTCSAVVTLADLCLVPQIDNAHRYQVDVRALPGAGRVCEHLEALPGCPRGARGRSRTRRHARHERRACTDRLARADVRNLVALERARTGVRQRTVATGSRSTRPERRMARLPGSHAVAPGRQCAGESRPTRARVLVPSDVARSL